MGRFLVNVMAPMLLPMIGILPLRPLPIDVPQPSLRVMVTVKDGQLFKEIRGCLTSVFQQIELIWIVTSQILQKLSDGALTGVQRAAVMRRYTSVRRARLLSLRDSQLTRGRQINQLLVRVVYVKLTATGDILKLLEKFIRLRQIPGNDVMDLVERHDNRPLRTD
jgi:hypothetical protein